MSMTNTPSYDIVERELVRLAARVSEKAEMPHSAENARQLFALADQIKRLTADAEEVRHRG